jgi:hypothetical protein
VVTPVTFYCGCGISAITVYFPPAQRPGTPFVKIDRTPEKPYILTKRPDTGKVRVPGENGRKGADCQEKAEGGFKDLEKRKSLSVKPKGTIKCILIILVPYYSVVYYRS